MAGRLPSEAVLAAAWEVRAYGARALVDDGGRRLRVVFPGRRWGGPGPDFRGAVLALSDGRLVRGDVEVHRCASGWADHRHAADPAYDAVVLHVVGRLDAATLDRHGRPIPTLVLPAEPRARPEAAGWAVSLGRADRPGAGGWALSGGPCVRTEAAVRRVVAAAGRERFRARVARLEGDLAAADADQVVWRAVAEGLGYSGNTQAFGRLADAVPWSAAAEAIAWRGPLGLAGLLLGTGGLLAEASLAEAHAYRAFERTRQARQMLARAAWDGRQQRAANRPAQRCRGLAELAARWAATRLPSSPSAFQPRGPARAVLAAVTEAVGTGTAPRGRRRAPALWRLVYAPPWIGRGRAQVLVINVLVPFAAAAGCAGAADLFERLSGEPSNRVVRYMADLLSPPTWPDREPTTLFSEPRQPPTQPMRFRGALLQQGLLHLFRATCASRRCGACPARGLAWPWLEEA